MAVVGARGQTDRIQLPVADASDPACLGHRDNRESDHTRDQHADAEKSDQLFGLRWRTVSQRDPALPQCGSEPAHGAVIGCDKQQGTRSTGKQEADDGEQPSPAPDPGDGGLSVAAGAELPTPPGARR